MPKRRRALEFGCYRGVRIDLVPTDYLLWFTKEGRWVPDVAVHELRRRARRGGEKADQIVLGLQRSGHPFRPRRSKRHRQGAANQPRHQASHLQACAGLDALKAGQSAPLPEPTGRQ